MGLFLRGGGLGVISLVTEIQNDGFPYQHQHPDAKPLDLSLDGFRLCILWSNLIANHRSPT